uniref:Integrase catalytic domain-containing protein n=1 Tax=Latimeria chalumnae TaxID=7897 RepID=H3AFM5_LATCH
CGKCSQEHEPMNYPAFSQMCRRCHRKNHFAKKYHVAVSINVHAVHKESDSDSESNFMIETVTTNEAETEWKVLLNINEKNVSFKLDMGAQCNFKNQYHLDKENYLAMIDYYSRFIEISRLQDTASGTVVNHIKSQFSRRGIPEVLISDNGPQFSVEFANFSKSYEFKHTTSSPKYPQSNGMLERAIQTIKKLFKKAKSDHKDPYLALLDLRNIPLEGLGSPAQMLMGRRTRTLIPTKPSLLKPNLIDIEIQA